MYIHSWYIPIFIVSLAWPDPFLDTRKRVWRHKTNTSLLQSTPFTLTWVIYTCSTSINITSVHYKESKQAGFCQSFIHQKFVIWNLPKFSSTKHLCYMIFWPRENFGQENISKSLAFAKFTKYFSLQNFVSYDTWQLLL